MAKYKILMNKETSELIGRYKAGLSSQRVKPGLYLSQALTDKNLKETSDLDFLNILLSTKKAIIYAESEIRANGADWNFLELKILGNINVAVPVTIYDNMGRGASLVKHEEPFPGELIFTAGCLLRSDVIVNFEIIGRILNARSTAISAKDKEVLESLRAIPDFDEVIDSNMQINQENYNNLVAGRFLPGLIHANSLSTQENKAIITIPGVGCGQFARHLQGQMAAHLDIAIKRLLSKHSAELQNIALVRFDPYNECLEHGNEEVSYGDLKYRVRPLTEELGKTQLCNPIDYQEAGDNFATHKLFKLVAWDQVSLPVNEGQAFEKGTDDANAGMSTNALEVLTGVEGEYRDGGLFVPKGFEEEHQHNWTQVSGVKHLVAGQDNLVFIPIN